MEDLSNANLSTVIDTEVGPSAAGGGAPTPVEIAPEPAKPASLREDLEAVFKDEKKDEAPAPKTEKEEPKADPTPKKEPEPKQEEAPKDDAKADADPAKADEVPPAKEAKPEEAREFKGPPKRFLPDSHEVWRNVPRSVRRDIETMEREHEAQVTQFRETSERYDRIRDFDELAQRNGRDLRESLERVNQIENIMAQNPIAGLNAILMEVGPRKADGQPFSLFEVAQRIAQQGPEGYQRMVAQPAPQQQRQPDPELAQVKAELQTMKMQQLTASVIEPFKAKHERYDELQDDIAFFLKSGKIPQTLSLHDRLAAAYDMAVRINPASHGTQTATNDDRGPGQDARRADPDFSGSKSIKSSPGSVTEEVEDQAKGDESSRDSILKVMRRLNA